MSDCNPPFTVTCENDVLAKNLAFHTIRLYRFWMKRHSLNDNKENTTQTSHLFSSLSFQSRYFRYCDIGLFRCLQCVWRDHLIGNFLSTNLSYFWRRKEQTETPSTIRLCVSFMSEVVVCYLTSIVTYLGMNDILRVKLTSLVKPEFSIQTFW